MLPAPVADPRLILTPDELEGGLELFVLAEAALWSAADGALASDPTGLGRGHYRAALLLKRRPGLGVQALAELTGLSKQGASRVMKDLEGKGLVAPDAETPEDARRRPMALTPEGRAFEQRVGERMRARLASAYRTGGLDAAPAARRILAALAGPRADGDARR